MDCVKQKVKLANKKTFKNIKTLILYQLEGGVTGFLKDDITNKYTYNGHFEIVQTVTFLYFLFKKFEFKKPVLIVVSLSTSALRKRV
jgi:hypothetical protein